MYDEPTKNQLKHNESPLESALNSQAKLLSELGEGLHRLEMKLKPVTRESKTDSVGGKENADRPHHSPVVAQIDSANITLRELVRQVSDLTANLEV